MMKWSAMKKKFIVTIHSRLITPLMSRLPIRNESQSAPISPQATSNMGAPVTIRSSKHCKICQV
jgi:hypothetical protein